MVSIFGNTGDGKSYTLNHALFGGHAVFETSGLQVTLVQGSLFHMLFPIIFLSLSLSLFNSLSRSLASFLEP